MREVTTFFPHNLKKIYITILKVNTSKLANEDILIVYDDLSLGLGKIRFRANGSDGGHNGIKSIINYIGTNNFFRMKVGIKSENKHDIIDFVLGKFSKSELNLIKFETLINSIDDFINKDINYVMNKYNGK